VGEDRMVTVAWNDIWTLLHLRALPDQLEPHLPSLPSPDLIGGGQ
jgi:hypothetical protein